MIVALIDYRAGNLTSVRKALTLLGTEILTPRTPGDLDLASAVIVPGVGHFQATAALDATWRSAIGSKVNAGIPLLGICLGQQWLFEGSSEAPDVPGLGVLPGSCVKLDPTVAGTAADALDRRASVLKVPHVGWNALKQTGRSSRLLAGVRDEAQAYFTHSYVAPESGATVATTTHGVTFPSVVETGLVFGAQFHPEKSGDVGLTILRNFLAVAAEQGARLDDAGRDGRPGQVSLPTAIEGRRPNDDRRPPKAPGPRSDTPGSEVR